MNLVNLADKLALFSDHWHPRIIGELNGQHVKIVKFRGEFVWHCHENEDELFLVLKGSFEMHFREPSGTEKMTIVNEGEFVIVPRGMEHRPASEDEVAVLLFEPANTFHTGNVTSDRTVTNQEWI